MEKKQMNVTIEIHYITNGNKVMQRGSFPLRRKKPEEVAFEWFRQIRREMPFGAELEKIIVDGEDVTELVKELDNAPLD
jgi:hypothetical protein